ncbi:MAG: leucyl/phenylalanyl-tRNA--protein transferase [Proteobacteria bacterium]|nr:leucyl/phenylalanyl-tRNA--protein transferase [Pseudomonadota bacterium]
MFPWFNQGDPIQWWSPSQRMVLFPDKFHLSRSLKKHIRYTQYSIHVNRDFESVIQHCSLPRSYQPETWITETMQKAYTKLFKQGHAFCLEIEFDGQLAGGIYGVKLAEVYCGESMFSTKSNGSKYALMALCQHMTEQNIPILDCQLYNPHLESMGAELISREQFVRYLPV